HYSPRRVFIAVLAGFTFFVRRVDIRPLLERTRRFSAVSACCTSADVSVGAGDVGSGDDIFVAFLGDSTDAMV
ncbi:MAG: hypothetical protein WC373_15435, partial [Smithella sp.]